MSLEHQQQVLKLLDAALSRPPEERPAFVARACVNSPELRRKVEVLVESAEKNPEFMEEPAFSVHAEDPDAGRRIGPYRLVRLLGRGGMGAVYLAVREDEFRQRVALKVIKRGMDTDEIVRRFESERQILAELRHPNIARLLDGGTTPDGLPWFAMDYVDGEPIDRYCDARKLSIRERLELFRKVCAAVRVAHQSLVVHRDLKPANILVDEAGEPRLLDFGVAKLLRPDPAGHTDGTAAARPLMTPKYASPEQVRGERVTTASDTYSLGVLLYQLLTGHPPYRLDSRSSEEAARVICEQEPQRPSTAVRGTEEIAGSDGTVVRLTPEAVSRTREDEPRRLRRRLAGDLDSIVLKALRKEPQHRYGSVEQFSADVGRHLDGLPVIARTGTAAYRAGKFVRRNRWALAVAAVFMLLIGGFTFTLLHGLQRTTEERDRARRLSSVLETLLETIQPSTPKPETAEMKAALDEVAGIFDETLRDYLLEQAVLLDGLGRAYRSYGYYEEAGPLLDKALEIRRQELGDRHLLVAESLHNLAFLHQEQGDQQTAEELLRRSLEIKYEHWTRDDPKLAPSLNNLAMVLRSRGVPGEAEGLFRRVLAIRREQYGDGAPELVRTLNNLGAVLVDRGAYEEAVEIYRRGLEIRRSFYGPGHVEVSLSRNSLANALFNLNEFEEAARLFREDLGSRLKIYDPDHPKVARARNNLAMVLHAQGHLEEAEDEFRAALEIQLSKLGKNHREVVVTKRNLAALLAAKGQPAAGERLAREALAIFRKTQVDGTWLIAYAESVLGACLTGLGRFPEAEGLLVGNYDPIRRVRGERSPYTRYVRDRIVELYEAWGKPELARQYFQDDSAPER